jgi:(p)ppGpp synthase/HD superfamily hydrolase
MSLTPEERQLNDAIALAADVHRSQVRKDPDGRPYICHVLDVVNTLPKANHLERMVAALHDTIEDSPATKRKALRSLINRKFGPKVLAGVEAMTHLKKEGLSEAAELAHYLAYVKTSVLANRAAVAVKVIDNYVNMKDRVAQFAAGGKDAENARKKLHQYASSVVELTKRPHQSK